MNFQEYPDHEMMLMEVAQRIAGALRAALRQQERVLFAVPGGTTPGPVFDDLCAADLDWSRVDVVLTDERWVPEDDPRSNTRLVRERLLQEHAAAATLVPLHREGVAPEEALAALTEALEGRLPIAVALIGMGADLHAASLFPGGEGLEAALAPDAPPLVLTRAADGDEQRITLSAPVLDGALSKHLLITGAEKRAALEGAQGRSSTEAPVLAILDETTVHWAE